MTQQATGVLHVCFCFTDASGAYHVHALVTLTSVFEHTTGPVCAHIVGDETLGTASKEAFTRLAERYGHEVCFHSVPDIPRPVLDNVRSWLGKGSLYRLFVPELIPENRVLYLDCDTICLLDIRAIVDRDMDDLPVAGVRDYAMAAVTKHSSVLRRKGINLASYANCGVLLIDLQTMRAKYGGFREEIFSILANETKFHFMDQDAINAYFQAKGSNICALPSEYNYFIGVDDHAYLPLSSYYGKLLHFTRDKPWNTFYPAALWYWRYYAKVFSCEEAFAAMEQLSKHEHAHLYAFLLRIPWIRRTLNRLHRMTTRKVA